MTQMSTRRGVELPQFSWARVGLIGAVTGVAHLAVASRYGWHRDELTNVRRSRARSDACAGGSAVEHPDHLSSRDGRCRRPRTTHRARPRFVSSIPLRASQKSRSPTAPSCSCSRPRSSPNGHRTVARSLVAATRVLLRPARQATLHGVSDQ